MDWTFALWLNVQKITKPSLGRIVSRYSSMCRIQLMNVIFVTTPRSSLF